MTIMTDRQAGRGDTLLHTGRPCESESCSFEAKYYRYRQLMKTEKNTISTKKCNNSPKSFPHPAKRNGRNLNEAGHKISEVRSFLEM